MRLHWIETKAKHLITDVFIFLEKTNRFYYIDDIDCLDKYVVLYFEASVLDHVKLKLKNEETVKIVSDYEIDSNMLENDLKENFNESDFESLEISGTKNKLLNVSQCK